MAKASRNVGFSVTVSMRALIRKLRPSPAGGSPHCANPVSGWRPVCDTTSAGCDGATFQRGRRFSSTVTPKSRISSSGEAVLVNRPHICCLRPVRRRAVPDTNMRWKRVLSKRHASKAGLSEAGNRQISLVEGGPVRYTHPIRKSSSHLMSSPPDHHQTPCIAITDSAIERAAGILRKGGLVGFPTETVYGLGGDACNAEAVAAIFAAKGRPSFNPLISHVASAADAFALGVETPLATALAAAFWPGPMTLILARVADCPLARLTSAGLDHIALRVPAHPAANRLLSAFGGPVAAPSANPSGQISPSRAEHVIAGLGGRIGLVLDGGRCDSGVESTVIDCTGEAARILRPGGITRDQVADCLDRAGLHLTDTPPPAGTDAPVSPGLLASHYAPRAALRMNMMTADPGMELIGFGDVDGAGTLALNLSPAGNLAEAAANLFDMLHDADATTASLIGVAPVPADGLGEAINDRLRRAAAPRG